MPDSHAHDTQAGDGGVGMAGDDSVRQPARGLRAGMADKRALRAAKRRGLPPPVLPWVGQHDAAMAAHAGGDYAGAMILWADLRKTAPDNAAGFVWGVLSAKAAGRDDVARALAGEGEARLPKLAEILRKAAAAPAWEAADDDWRTAIGPGRRSRKAALDAALAPLKQASLGKKLRRDLVLARLRLLQQKYPDSKRVQAAILSMLYEMGRLEEAGRLAEYGVAKFPDYAPIVLVHVAVLDKQESYQEAYAAIAALRGRVAPDPAIEVAHSQALSRLERFDAAETACAASLADFPESFEVAAEFATLATRRGAWTDAISRWEAAETKWPNKSDIQRALKALRLLVVDTATAAAPEETSESGAMFGRLESLGGSVMGCEFGIVQRYFGSTALGLLRWSTIKADGLCQGLRNGFAGLGELDNVVITTYRNAAGREEYVVSDCTYGFASHTYISTKDAPADKMKVQTARRLTFMCGKLMEDLQAAAKLFVYKYQGEPSEDDARSLFAAARSKGDISLLCVMKARDGHGPGTVRQVQDGLFIGYVRSFLNVGPEDIDYVTWKAVCTEALLRFDASRAPA